METGLFDFALPPDRIALRPASPRDTARLLRVDPASSQPLADYTVRDLPQLLRPGDALVFNDTKVFPAELHGVRLRDGRDPVPLVLTLHRKTDADTWHTFARPARRLKPGDKLLFEGGLEAEVVSRQEGEVLVRFMLSDDALAKALLTHGHVPLPPYISSQRKADEKDKSDYQTVFAQYDGSIAAPTAGLHFTPGLLQGLAEAGISRHFVTLHVGAGTFLPVKSEQVEDHIMHAEWGSVTSETAGALNEVREKGGRIVAVGTTSLRLLESAANERGKIRPFSGETAIFITPGYRFRAAEILLTNFHLPRSTLFMLVCAFSGLEAMQDAYKHAIAQGYRFYSYGDACLLFRQDVS